MIFSPMSVACGAVDGLHDPGLALNRRQAIILINDDPVQRRLYVALAINHLPLDKMAAILQMTFHFREWKCFYFD